MSADAFPDVGPVLRAAQEPVAPSVPRVSTEATGRSFSLAKYRAEAKSQPFDLELDDGTVLRIPPPSTETMLSADVNDEDVKALLHLLCGKQYDALMAAIGPESWDVMVAILKDMQEHFGMGESPASVG